MQKMNNRLNALRRRYLSRLKKESSIDKINRLARIKSRRKEIFNNDSSKEQDSEDAMASDEPQKPTKSNKIKRRRKRKNSKNEAHTSKDSSITKDQSFEDPLRDDIEHKETTIDEQFDFHFSRAFSKRNSDSNISKVLLMSLLSGYIDNYTTFNRYDEMCQREDIWNAVNETFKTYGITCDVLILRSLWKNVIKCTQMNIVEKEKTDNEVELSELDMEMIYFFPELINEGLDEMRMKVTNTAQSEALKNDTNKGENSKPSEYKNAISESIEHTVSSNGVNSIKTEICEENHINSSATCDDHNYSYIPSSPDSSCDPNEYLT